jgi:hypothetical protein
MPFTRRSFLRVAASAGAAAAASQFRSARGEDRPRPGAEELSRILESPVLKLEGLSAPVTVASLELLHNRGSFLVRARSREGAESVTSPNPERLRDCYPVFLHRVAPFFIGKYVPNSGPFQEFKGESRIPLSCPTSSLKCEKGMVRCPSGPGFGIGIDRDFVAGAAAVTAI